MVVAFIAGRHRVGRGRDWHCIECGVYPGEIDSYRGEIRQRVLERRCAFSSIDLTFYSTFPNFTLDVRDGSVVTKVFQGAGRDTCFAKTDSLVNFKRCKITVNPLAFLSRQDIIVRRLILVKPDIYAYIDTNGMPGWNILRPTADTVTMTEEASTDTLSSGEFAGKIDIRRIRVIDGNIVFDDRANRLYSRFEGVNLNLSAAYEGVEADLEMKLGMKNCILWQEGNVLVRRTALDIETGLRVIGIPCFVCWIKRYVR